MSFDFIINENYESDKELALKSYLDEEIDSSSSTIPSCSLNSILDSASIVSNDSTSLASSLTSIGSTINSSSDLLKKKLISLNSISSSTSMIFNESINLSSSPPINNIIINKSILPMLNLSNKVNPEGYEISSNILIDKSSTPRLPELASSLTSTPTCTSPLKNVTSSTNNSSQVNSPMQSPRPPSTSSSSSSASTFNFNCDDNSINSVPSSNSSFLKKNRKTKVVEESIFSNNNNGNSVNTNLLSNSPSTPSITLDSCHSSNSISQSCSSSTLNTFKIAALKHSNSNMESNPNILSAIHQNSINLPDNLSFQTKSHTNVLKIINGIHPRIIGANSDNILYIYDFFNGKIINSLSGHTDRIISMAIYTDFTNEFDMMKFKLHGDNEVINNNNTKEINTRNENFDETKIEEQKKFLQGKSINSLSSISTTQSTNHFLNSNQSSLSQHDFILTGSRDNTIKLWHLNQMKCIHTIKAHQSPIWSVEISFNYMSKNFSLISASASGSIKIFDGYTGNLKFSLNCHKDKINSLCCYFLPLKLINDNSESSKCTTVNQELLFSAGADSIICCWDLENGSLIKSIPTQSEEITSLSVSSYQGFPVLTPVLLNDRVNDLIENYGSALIVSGCKDGVIRVWEFHSETFLFELLGHNKSITSLKLSYIPSNYNFLANQSNVLGKNLKNGTPIVISSYEDGQIKVWNVLNHRLINSIKLYKSSILNLDVKIFYDKETWEENIFVASSSMDKIINVKNLLDFLKKGSIFCSIS